MQRVKGVHSIGFVSLLNIFVLGRFQQHAKFEKCACSVHLHLNGKRFTVWLNVLIVYKWSRHCG